MRKRILIPLIVIFLTSVFLTGCGNNISSNNENPEETTGSDNFKYSFEEISKEYISNYVNNKYDHVDKDIKFKSENVEIVQINRYAHIWESIGEIKALDSLFKVTYDEDKNTLKVVMYTKESVTEDTALEEDEEKEDAK